MRVVSASSRRETVAPAALSYGASLEIDVLDHTVIAGGHVVSLKARHLNFR